MPGKWTWEKPSFTPMWEKGSQLGTEETPDCWQELSMNIRKPQVWKRSGSKSICVQENCSSGLFPRESRWRQLCLLEVYFSAKGQNEINIASDHMHIACNSTAWATLARLEMQCSMMPFWWCEPMPQKIIVCALVTLVGPCASLHESQNSTKEYPGPRHSCVEPW